MIPEHCLGPSCKTSAGPCFCACGPCRAAQQLLGQPQVLRPGEDFVVSLPMPPIPCTYCGADLRGRTACLVEPREEGGRTVFKPACVGCARERGLGAGDREGDGWLEIPWRG